jgi:hypothetical protein
MKKTTKFNFGLLLFVAFVFAAIYYFVFHYETEQQKFVREREAKERVIGEPIKQFAVKIADYSDLKFPAKMQEKPKLKPKLAVIYDDSSRIGFDGFTKFYHYDGDVNMIDARRFEKEKPEFGFTENELAQTTDEIGTVIKIACQDGKLAGVSTNVGKSKPRSGGGLTSGTPYSTFSYASVCKVTVFDMAEKALIAEKTFTNPVYDLKAEPLDDNEKTHGAGYTKRPIASELYDFLQELKKN